MAWARDPRYALAVRCGLLVGLLLAVSACGPAKPAQPATVVAVPSAEGREPDTAALPERQPDDECKEWVDAVDSSPSHLVVFQTPTVTCIGRSAAKSAEEVQRLGVDAKAAGARQADLYVDKETPHRNVVEVIDALRSVGLTHIVLEVRPAPEP